MAESTDENQLRRANFRLCILCMWPNYPGLGFNVESSSQPPYLIRTVESNSPAAAGGLKILDCILAVNNQDVSKSDYTTVTQAIKNARDSNRIELLVVEKRYYGPLKDRGVTFNSMYAKTMQTPSAMPLDYLNFPKYTPRTCEIRLTKPDQPFGFEVVNGIKDIGAFIQEVLPNTPASQTSLRKSDKILEIDDKFVDNEPNRMILERLGKAKAKRSLKLYVVDTFTYKHFIDNKIPLPSKDYRKCKFAKEQLQQQQQQQQTVTSTYINVQDISTEPKTADVNVSRPILNENLLTTITTTSSENLNGFESHHDDIRLCTITRVDATDTYGLELNYHKRDNYHTLKVTTGRNNGPSNAALAGVKGGDHLIEVNGENIEKIGDAQVQTRIRSIKYPQPLQLLVTDSSTYKYYKQQNKTIHNGLPTVQKLPINNTNRSPSPISSQLESSTNTIPIVRSVPIEELLRNTSTVHSAMSSSIQPRLSSLENSLNNRRQYQLQRIPDFRGYGFSVNSNHGGVAAHKITQIAPNSPAAQQGLRVGDYILSVNNKNVEKMSPIEFNQFLRSSSLNAETHGTPLLLEVINEDAYQPMQISDNLSTRQSKPDPISSIISTNEDTTKQTAYYRAQRSGPSRDASVRSTVTQSVTSRDISRKPSITQSRISRNESRRLPTPQPIISRTDSRKLSITQQNKSPDENRQPSSSQTINNRNDNVKLTTNQVYMNGYDSLSHEQYSRQNGYSSPSSIDRSRANLSRGAVDVVSRNRLLRYCRLHTQPGQPFGFQLKPDDDNHIVWNIQPDSPAARAGLSENDRLIEVNDQDVERKSNKEVANLIRTAALNGTLRLFIAPAGVKVLSKRSAKSLSSINDDRSYRTKSNDYESTTTMSRYRSQPRLNDEQNNEIFSEPTEPLPRKCVLERDPSFAGCGFRIIEKENYDTPIIIEISPNSPAKRGGLIEGDHIIYIESQNVQNFRSFTDITDLIQRQFEENGQITLVTLTGPAYQVLKRRGGYLDNTIFDYHTKLNNQLKPRLYKLKLFNHEHDFGFTLHRNDYIYIKNIQHDSSADIYGLQKGDIVLELNGRYAKYLTIEQIKHITDISKQERKLDILVIDIDGYRYSTKHAIPINSYLPFVEIKEGRETMINHRAKQEPVYL